MQYAKPPLTVEEQVDLLISRGLVGDRSLMIARLQAVNYYRLSGYWFPFRNSDDTFQAGATFETAWARYAFDRRLRLSVMDAIERIEVTVRTRLAYEHSHAYGPFNYMLDPASLPCANNLSGFHDAVKEEYRRVKDGFASHFRKKYGDQHGCLPIWMAIELMSFGTTFTFFRACSLDLRDKVSANFGVSTPIFENWLMTLNTVRNVCAHHARLWNRVLGIKPKIPRHRPEWHSPAVIRNERLFAVLTVCKFCLDRIAPQSCWPSRVIALMDASPEIPLSDMGFPTNWKDYQLWKR